MSDASRLPPEPAGLTRAVGRWQILGLSINSVVGSGVYLLPATAFALLGSFSVWGVLAAGLIVSLLVLVTAEWNAGTPTDEDWDTHNRQTGTPD